jgi:NTP pyrophosphatase (non-canonical NTP hydrolase)
MKNIIELESERLEWSLKTFPDATHLSSLEKLKSEIKEVAKELKYLDKFPDQDPVKLPEEYADCLMCLFDSAGRAGITVEEIFEAFEEKLEINKNRKWVKNPDNTYSHIKLTSQTAQ